MSFQNDKSFIIYWLDGHTSVVKGIDEVDAFRKAGIQRGAVAAIDFFATYIESVGQTHEWNTNTKQWVRTTPIIDVRA